MYHVNLLPEQYLKNARNQAIKNRLIYGSILLLLVLFMFYRLLISYGNQSYDRYNSLAQDNLRLTKLISQLKDSGSSTDDADMINSIIERIAGTGRDFRSILVTISNSAPDSVAISHFSLSAEGKGITCVLQAAAGSYDTVSEWIGRLSETDDIGEITLSYIAAAEESDDGRVEFELRIPIGRAGSGG